MAACSLRGMLSTSCRRPVRAGSTALHRTFTLSRHARSLQKGDDAGLDGYSNRALARVWKAQRFSWWMTMLLHRFPDNSPYDEKLQETDLSYLFSSEAALRSLAENYVGLPF
jgi:2-polyprenyl-6-methoxyphenol hydroxylase-like FAD-dependent oxidoreductase